MFLLKKVITPFLQLPGIFIILLIITGAWLLYKKNRKAGMVTLILGCFTWALSISPVSDIMINGLESSYGIPKIVEGDVIILLGHMVYGNAPDLSGVGAPSEDYLNRIVAAVRLQKRLNIPIIIAGAETSSHKLSTNYIVKRFMMDLGVPDDEIIIEAKSRDTFENAKYTKEICAKLDFANPVLVTSAYHMKRAVMSFDRVGLKVQPLPSGFKSWQGKQYEWITFLPGDFRTASIAINEYIGLVFYKYFY